MYGLSGTHLYMSVNEICLYCLVSVVLAVLLTFFLFHEKPVAVLHPI